MKRIRVGMIGLGDIAEKAYLPVLASHPEVEWVGFMSRSPVTVQQFGERYRVPGRFTDIAGLLALSPEAVFIHAPTPAHYELVLSCLQAGVHVYVDKPLSYEIAESEAMAAAAERAGKLLAVGFNRRFAPLYQEAKAYMEAAGGWEMCMADKHRTRQQGIPAKQTLYDDLIHMIDLVAWLCGGADEIDYYRQLVDSSGRLLEASGQIGTAAAGSEQGKRGSFRMSRRAGMDLERLELHGGGRSVQVLNLDTAVFASASEGTRQQTYGSWDTISYRRGFAGAIQHFLDNLRTPESCELRADLVLPTHRLIERLVARV